MDNKEGAQVCFPKELKKSLPRGIFLAHRLALCWWWNWTNTVCWGLPRSAGSSATRLARRKSVHINVKIIIETTLHSESSAVVFLCVFVIVHFLFHCRNIKIPYITKARSWKTSTSYPVQIYTPLHHGNSCSVLLVVSTAFQFCLMFQQSFALHCSPQCLLSFTRGSQKYSPSQTYQTDIPSQPKVRDQQYGNEHWHFQWTQNSPQRYLLPFSDHCQCWLFCCSSIAANPRELKNRSRGGPGGPLRSPWRGQGAAGFLSIWSTKRAFSWHKFTID